MSIDLTTTILPMHSDPIMTIRENVERLKALHGIATDVDLAERAGVNQSTIWKLLKANPPKAPKLDTLEGVATALKVAVWQLAMPNLPVGSPAVVDVRGGLSAEALSLCAVYQALPAQAQREVLSFAEFQASRNSVSGASVNELRGMISA